MPSLSLGIPMILAPCALNICIALKKVGSDKYHIAWSMNARVAAGRAPLGTWHHDILRRCVYPLEPVIVYAFLNG